MASEKLYRNTLQGGFLAGWKAKFVLKFQGVAVNQSI